MSGRNRMSLRRCALLLAALLAAPAQSQTPALSEYQVKAGFIFNFARMVEWPARSRGPTLRLCMLGDDPFGPIKEQIAGKLVDGRKLEIRMLDTAGEAAGCDMLFIAASASHDLTKLLAATKGVPVLTIGDSEGLAAQGLVIGFYRSGDEVRFEINIDAAARAGLQVSSRLLNLARRVHDGAAP